MVATDGVTMLLTAEGSRYDPVTYAPGPNSHFYTIDPGECQALKNLQATTPASQKRWNFEHNDFLSTPASFGACPTNTTPIWRAYNRGFEQGIDSNHRLTSDQAAILQTIAGAERRRRSDVRPTMNTGWVRPYDG